MSRRVNWEFTAEVVLWVVLILCMCNVLTTRAASPYSTNHTYILRRDLTPPPYTWRDLVRRVEFADCTLLAAPCDGMPARTYSAHPLCHKPVVLLFLSEHRCSVCQQFLRELLVDYASELRMLREYATLVHIDSPINQTFSATTYPLPVTLPPVVTGAGHANKTDREGAQVMRQRALHHARELAASLSSVVAVRHPKRVQEAFAGQGDYIVRALFLYPHNGSVMSEVVNEDLFEGSDKAVHFYLTARPFLASLRKAISVMDRLHKIQLRQTKTGTPD